MTPLLIPELATGPRANSRHFVLPPLKQWTGRVTAHRGSGFWRRGVSGPRTGLVAGRFRPDHRRRARRGTAGGRRPVALAGTKRGCRGQRHGRARDFDALLVMGDGSASRTEKAPRHLDDRAVPFDDHVLAAIGRGVPQNWPISISPWPKRSLPPGTRMETTCTAP